MRMGLERAFMDGMGLGNDMSVQSIAVLGAGQMGNGIAQVAACAGYDVTIPIGGARLSFPGQVLGCNYSGDDPSIGHYLFLGSGDFHPIGLVLHTG